MKLTSRYNQITLPIPLILILISSIASYALITKVIKNELDKNMLRIERKIRNYVGKENKLPSINSFNNDIIEFEKANKPVFDTGFQTYNIVITKNHHTQLFRKLVFLLNVKEDIYKTTIIMPLEGTNHVTNIIFDITISIIFLIILITIITNQYLLSKLWLPFYHSLELLRQFKIDNPKPLSFPDTRINEFNFMIDNLKALTSNGSKTYQLLKEFTENSSHEIQTPLSIIRSKLDILIQNERLCKKESETAKTIYSAIDKLSRLSQSFLLITKIGNSQFENKIRINLYDKVLDKLAQFEELWQINNIEITSELHDSEIIANDELIDILLNNLLSNATKHNEENGKIMIKLSSGYLSVYNTGSKIPLDQNFIFKRYYKANNQNENNGLGLSIIKQICDTSDITPTYSYSENMHLFSFNWQTHLNLTITTTC